MVVVATDVLVIGTAHPEGPGGWLPFSVALAFRAGPSTLSHRGIIIYIHG